MSATGYTTIYNEVLRDSTLSLDAKGLFAVIKSFIGLPDFALSKRRLGYACSDSGYLLNAAWKELKQKGYLQHYFSQSENGAFCHVYNLMQHPSEPVDFVYSPSIDRPNGDVVCISDAQRDYTNISTSVLRDKTISLASKGLLFSVPRESARSAWRRSNISRRSGSASRFPACSSSTAIRPVRKTAGLTSMKSARRPIWKRRTS